MFHHLMQRRPFNGVRHGMVRTNCLLDLAIEGKGDGRIEQRAIEGLVGNGDGGGEGGSGGGGKRGTTGGVGGGGGIWGSWRVLSFVWKKG